MLTAVFFCCLPLLNPASGHEDSDRLAKLACNGYESLHSLSFEAVVRGYQWSSSGSGMTAEGLIHEVFKVWMADGQKFRVEMFKGPKCIALVVCNGVDVTEWDASENVYTQYPTPRYDEHFTFQSRFQPVSRGVRMGCFCASWVSKKGMLAGGLKAAFTSADTRRMRHCLVDGVECDVLVKEECHSGLAPAPYHFVVKYTYYLDRNTHLLVKQRFGSTVLTVAASVYRLTTTYRSVEMNGHLPANIFTFKPPEGAKFIPPDDPRFRAKETVQLTGKPAPAFSLPRVEAKRDSSPTGEDEARQETDEGTRHKPQETKPVSLADFKDKKAVLVVFWATWCLPCQKEIPSLIKLHEELSDKGLAVVGICGGEKSERDVQTLLKKRPLPYLVLYDEKQDATQAYGAKSVPYTILIDKTGTVVRVWQGWSGEEEEKQIREEIGKLLAGPTTAAADPDE